MATFYVNSAAGGANDGTSETDAWTSLASAVGVAAGSIVWISHTHNQNPGASGTYTFTNGTIAAPIILLSVDFSTNTYTPASSAQFSGAASDFILQGNVTAYGLRFDLADDFTLGTTDSGVTRLVDCYLKAGDDIIFSAGDGALREMQGGTLEIAAGSALTMSGDGATMLFRGVTFAGTGGSVGTMLTAPLTIFEDCDLTIFSGTLFAAPLNSVILRRCKIHASLAVGGSLTLPGIYILLEQCDDGTITVPALGLTQYRDLFGTASATLARYRTGGANDGLQANAYSWDMTTGTNVVEIYRALRSPPLTVFADPDASISSATAKGVFTSTRCQPLATPAALDTDGTSTWNGADVGTKQLIEHTLTNGDTLTVYVASGGTLNDDDFWIEVSEPDQVGGPVSVRCCLAKPSTTVFVDAVAWITGSTQSKSYMTGGVQVFEPSTGGGAASMMRPVSMRGGLV